MAKDYKSDLLRSIEARFGTVTRLPGSQSLVELKGGIRIYLRYSKIHGKGVTFYGLRQVDLNALDGHQSFLCFFTDREPPLFIPYGEFEAVIRQSPLASDGQYKVQIAFSESTREFYLPRVGHFNVDAFGGLDALPVAGSSDSHTIASHLSHWQAQTLLGSIGVLKGYSVFIPPNNIELLDWSMTQPFQPITSLPSHIDMHTRFASEIDIIWVDHKHDAIAAAFEIEHSTPIYSGLLRFNDVLLTCPGTSRFFVVSNESRRDLFVRQLHARPFNAAV